MKAFLEYTELEAMRHRKTVDKTVVLNPCIPRYELVNTIRLEPLEKAGGEAEIFVNNLTAPSKAPCSSTYLRRTSYLSLTSQMALHHHFCSLRNEAISV